MKILLLFAYLICFVGFAVSSDDLSAADFDNTVLKDDRVWLVEFYSPMCGSCTEFAPTWEKISASMKSVATGKINIDIKEGMELANKLGVLEEGATFCIATF